jgi:hypothetical protein
MVMATNTTPANGMGHLVSAKPLIKPSAVEISVAGITMSMEAMK